jgi:hypothetical protein
VHGRSSDIGAEGGNVGGVKDVMVALVEGSTCRSDYGRAYVVLLSACFQFGIHSFVLLPTPRPSRSHRI